MEIHYLFDKYQIANVLLPFIPYCTCNNSSWHCRGDYTVREKQPTSYHPKTMPITGGDSVLS